MERNLPIYVYLPYYIFREFLGFLNSDTTKIFLFFFVIIRFSIHRIRYLAMGIV